MLAVDEASTYPFRAFSRSTLIGSLFRNLSLKRLKVLLLGSGRNPTDPGVFHHISLIPFLAWIGLGADGLSSSAYGPEETFLALQGHAFLGLFVALAVVATIFIISASYSQVVGLFPSGGGGYLVASKLLSPTVGMISGCALLIDYVLTIAISVASGADALFSMLPPEFWPFKLWFALAGVVGLTVLNLRGVKESILPLVPVFLLFVATHVAAIGWAVFSHLLAVEHVVSDAVSDAAAAHAEVGWMGMLFLMLRSYTLGAGTYTGIEAVSNGMSILREPRVRTARRTLLYMASSLAFVAFGLMLSYLLYRVEHVPGKTLNAVLFESIASSWGGFGPIFVVLALVSEAIILFAAAQAGFLDGPRILGNMAVDRWLPSRFRLLSDRLVTQNGIVLMGIAALVTVVLSGGSVKLLIVLYSINVFITFTLTQLGMVRHWWKHRGPGWRRSIAISGSGLALCSTILVAVVVFKFHEGGWITLLITGLLALVAFGIRSHYRGTLHQIRELDRLVRMVDVRQENEEPAPAIPPDPSKRTAVILVNGFNGLGMHTFLNIPRMLGDTFANFVFVSVGVLDAGNYKGVEEIERLREETAKGLAQYVEFARRQEFGAEARWAVGIDPVEEIASIALELRKTYRQLVFFGGSLVFRRETTLTRLLHNNVVFAVQRRLYLEGVPFVILPVRV